MKNFQFKPIGYLVSEQVEKYMAPKQAELGFKGNSKIILSPNFNFEQALEGLDGFNRIWVIYLFHHNHTWTPKVRTPRGPKKRGVFATRSPHRPNPIGLSCVELLDIQGRSLIIGKNDLIDGTPILDIKPYLIYADSFPESTQGWLEEESSQKNYEIEWSLIAKQQANFIEAKSVQEFTQTVELRLKTNPFPFPSHRIKKTGESSYELSLKTWRVNYQVYESYVRIHHISSGYDEETLKGNKVSRWEDVPIHIEFINLPQAK